MRLIDADKLFATCTLTAVNGHLELSGWFAAERITEAPTVEAIPIEWLKKKYEEADDMGMGIEDWSEKDCFGYVIKAWEKENETR